MGWLRNMRARRLEIALARRELSIALARLNAVEYEMAKLVEMDIGDPAYRMNFSMLIDRYNDIASLKNILYGRGFFYTLTGKRWLLWGE